MVIFSIIASILIFEVSFRFWGCSTQEECMAQPRFHFYPFNPQFTDTIRWYVYHIFEHYKVIGFCVCIAIVFTRFLWLPLLFSLDLISYLLNYSSTWAIVDGFPIGMDLLKSVTFTVVVLVELIRYAQRLHPGSNVRIGYFSHASGLGTSGSWSYSYNGVLRFCKTLLSGNNHSRKTS